MDATTAATATIHVQLSGPGQLEENCSGAGVAGNVYDVVANCSVRPTQVHVDASSSLHIYFTCVAVLIIFGTIFGNILVIIAVCTEKRLRKVGNSFIVSLAMSDLLVGLVVMPVALAYNLMPAWYFGVIICDIWITVDVVCCTASIVNLCVISFDRYNAITQPLRYALKRTPRRAGIMILLVWTYTLLIATPPLMGWREPRPATISECTVSQDIGYTIFSTFGAFYVPLLVMLVMYARIYVATVKRKRRWVKHPTSGNGKKIGKKAEFAVLINATDSIRRHYDHIKTENQPPEKKHPRVWRFAMCDKLVRKNTDCQIGVESDPESRSPSYGSPTQSPGRQNLLRTSCEKRHAIYMSTVEYKKPLVVTISNSNDSSQGTTTTTASFDTTYVNSDQGFESDTSDNARSPKLLKLPLVKRRRAKNRRLSRQVSNPASSGVSGCGDVSYEASDVAASDPETSTTIQECRRSLLSLPSRGGSGGRKHSFGLSRQNSETDASFSDGNSSIQETGFNRENSSFIERALARGSASRRRRKNKISVSQEKSAAKTLGIIMGCFSLCWLPFFIVSLIGPLCAGCYFHPVMMDVFTWLGYFNSALNPIIYTFFNKDFRLAFRRILSCQICHAKTR